MPSKTANLVYIGAGSNLGDSKAILAEAASLLNEKLDGSLVASPIYYSEPVEVTEQPWFFNQVFRGLLSPEIGPTSFLKILKEIEMKLGRKPNFRYGPRLIDLDLLFFNDWVFETTQLSIPHPKFKERSFVLLPLLDLDPDLRDPRSGLSVSELWKQVKDNLATCKRIIVGNS